MLWWTDTCWGVNDTQCLSLWRNTHSLQSTPWWRMIRLSDQTLFAPLLLQITRGYGLSFYIQHAVLVQCFGNTLSILAFVLTHPKQRHNLTEQTNKQTINPAIATDTFPNSSLRIFCRFQTKEYNMHFKQLIGIKTSLPVLLEFEKVFFHFRRTEIWTLLLEKTQEAELRSRLSRLVGCKSLLNLLFQYPYSGTNSIRTRSQRFILTSKGVHWCHMITRCKRPFQRSHWGASLQLSLSKTQAC